MIFGELIGTAFLIFLGIRIAQGLKRRRAAYKGVETKRGTAGGAHLKDRLIALKAKEKPSLKQMANAHKTAFDLIKVYGDTKAKNDGRYAVDGESVPVKRLVSDEIIEQGESVLTNKSSLQRIKHLPQLQQAVVWAEILGKPRSERKLSDTWSFF